MLKKKKIILPMSQNITQSVGNKLRMTFYCCKKPTLLRGKQLRNNVEFHYLNYLHLCRTKNNLDSHKTVYVHKDFCIAVISSENTKIVEYN